MDLDDNSGQRRELDRDLEQARTGDREALNRVLQHLHERLLREADKRVGDHLRQRTRVSDVLQDAYVEIVNRIQKFAGQTMEEFYVWARQIVESSARTQHRHLNAQKRRGPSRTSQLEELARWILRVEKTPLSELESAESMAIVLAALESLREDYRLVIEQVSMKGRSAAEVAADLGRSEPATRMLLSRARAALLLAIEKREGGGDGPACVTAP